MFVGYWYVDQVVGMFDYEVDVFGVDVFGGYDQVVFVFVVFVIYQDDYFVLVDVFDQFVDCVECYGYFFM